MVKRKAASRQETKAALKTLKAKGLYSGDLRKAPTDYARRLTRQYADVVKGSAHVISVPRRATKTSKGIVAARQEAKSLAEAYGLAVRNKGAHLVVKTVSPTDKVIYSPKKQLLEIERFRSSGIKERIELKSHMYLAPQSDGTLDWAIRDLRANESYAVPFNRGNGRIDYMYFGSKAELLAMLNEYGKDRIDPRYKPRSHKGNYNPVIKGWNVAPFVSVARLITK